MLSLICFVSICNAVSIHKGSRLLNDIPNEVIDEKIVSLLDPLSSHRFATTCRTIREIEITHNYREVLNVLNITFEEFTESFPWSKTRYLHRVQSSRFHLGTGDHFLVIGLIDITMKTHMKRYLVAVLRDGMLWNLVLCRSHEDLLWSVKHCQFGWGSWDIPIPEQDQKRILKSAFRGKVFEIEDHSHLIYRKHKQWYSAWGHRMRLYHDQIPEIILVVVLFRMIVGAPWMLIILIEVMHLIVRSDWLTNYLDD